MNQKQKLIWVLPAILVLLVAITFAVRFGLSNIYYFQAERDVAFWGHNGTQPTSQQMVDAQQLMAKALTYWPANPDYLLLVAQIQGWQAFVQKNDAGFRQGVIYLSRALKSRPAHAHTWALLAEFKHALGEQDAVWDQAIENTLKFGGHDIELVKRMQLLQ